MNNINSKYKWCFSDYNYKYYDEFYKNFYNDFLKLAYDSSLESFETGYRDISFFNNYLKRNFLDEFDEFFYEFFDDIYKEFYLRFIEESNQFKRFQTFEIYYDKNFKNYFELILKNINIRFLSRFKSEFLRYSGVSK